MRNVLKMPKANDSEAEPVSPSKMAGGSDGGPPTDILERVMRIEASIPTLATKSDLMELRMELRTEMHKEFGSLRGEMHQEFGGLRSEMHQEIGGVRGEMRQEIGGLRSEMHQEIGKLRAEMHQAIGELRAEMYKGFAQIHEAIQMQTWRILGLFFGIMIPACGGMIAATYYIANHAVK